MKALKIVVIILIILIALFVIIGFILPSKVHVERIATINAPSKFIFDQVNNFRNFHKWSPWSDLDTNIKVVYAGPDDGIGACYSWRSKNKDVGNGKMTILQSERTHFVKIELYFEDEGTSYMSWKLNEENGATKVIWSIDMDAGKNLFLRYIGLFMDKMIGPDFEKGLNKLKDMINVRMKKFDDVQLSIEEFKGQKYYSVTDSSSLDSRDISEKIGQAFKEIYEFIKDKNLVCIGPPIAITNRYLEGQWVFCAAFPVKDNSIKPEGRIQTTDLKEMKVIRAITVGPYSEIGIAYDRIMDYIEKNKLTMSERSWEEYISDPVSTPLDKIITVLYFPVQ